MTEVQEAPVVAEASTSAVPANVSPATREAVAQTVATAAAESPAQPTPNGKVYADWGELIAKAARTDDVRMMLRQKDGREVERYIRIEAISGPAYDKLVEKHPPNSKQRDAGFVYNQDSFLPALIAACAKRPTLTVEQIKELVDSETWSSGELGGLFMRCQRLCNASPDLSFTLTD